MMPREILPAIGHPDESDGPRAPWRRAGEGQRVAASRGEEHFVPFVVGKPGGVVSAAIYKMQCQQAMKTIVVHRAAPSCEADTLEDNVAVRIGKHELFDDIASVTRRIAQYEGGHAIVHRLDDAHGVALLFREIALAVRDDEAEIAGARVVYAGIVDLIENAMAQGEPDAARDGGCGPDPAFRARRPARGNARMAGRRISAVRSHLEALMSGSPSEGTRRTKDVKFPDMCTVSWSRSVLSAPTCKVIG